MTTRILPATFCVFAFLIYAAAIFAQGQYAQSFWGSDNYTQLPGAISYAAHSSPLGTFNSKIQAMLVGVLQGTGSITQAVSIAASSNGSGGEMEIAKDGIGAGYLVFASLSMKIFGARIDALPLGMLALLGTSLLLFMARFSGVQLVVPTVVFVTLTTILLTPVTTDPETVRMLPIGGSRYMGVIGILPALHIINELLDRPPLSWRSLTLLSLQAILLVLAVIIRASTAYFLFAIAIPALWILWRGKNVERVKALGASTALAAAFAVMLLILAAAVPSEYRSSGRLFGNFWHRVFISTSLHKPWPYGKLREMFDCTNAFPEGLALKHDNAGHCAWYARHPSYHPTPAELSWDMNHNFYDAEYERLMRDAFLRIVREYPREIFETFLYDKSELLGSTLVHAFTLNAPRTEGLVDRAWPFAAAQWLLGIFFLLGVNGNLGQYLLRLTVILTALLLFSLLPLYAVYGVLYVSLDPVIYLYAIAVVLLLSFLKFAMGIALQPGRR